jgi:hypothetical protein
LYAHVHLPQRSTFVFLIIGDTFQTIRVTVDITTEIRRTEQSGPALRPCPSPVFAAFAKQFAVLDRPRMSLSVFDEFVSRRLFLETDNDIFQFIDHENFLYCPTRSVIATHDRVLAQTRSPITHVATNFEFRTFAVSTRDGTVGVYSFPSGNCIIESALGVDVNHLIVTEKLGLVVAFGEGKVSVLSADGQLVKTALFPQNIPRIYQFASFNDFDFIVFETEEHQLGFFEAFYPENIAIFCQLNEGTVQVVYAQTITAFLVLLESGILRVVPQDIKLNDGLL